MASKVTSGSSTALELAFPLSATFRVPHLIATGLR